MKIIIVDDERLARDRLRALVNETGVGEVVGEAGNGRDALGVIHALHPDVVLLDIRMPGMDGMKVAQELKNITPTPIIIFTTAYGDHALEAFEHQAVDYLLKPIRKDRLEKALYRAKALLNPEANSYGQAEGGKRPAARSHISVTIRGELRLIPVNQIYYFMADEKYVILYWTQGEVLIGETLKDLEQEFAGQFLRIHRSTLVSMVHITSLSKDSEGRSYIRLKGRTEMLEVSRRHLPEVRKILKDMRISGA
jgi:two-component system response regulator AlgR